MKILIADDHAEFRANLSGFLGTQDGIEIVGEASDGREAILLAENLLPDLVLLDISMPKMSGIQVAQYLKEHFPGIKIILVTIHEEQTYQTIADYLGVDGFVSKNSLRENLPRVLQQIAN